MSTALSAKTLKILNKIFALSFTTPPLSSVQSVGSFEHFRTLTTSAAHYRNNKWPRDLCDRAGHGFNSSNSWVFKRNRNIWARGALEEFQGSFKGIAEPEGPYNDLKNDLTN